MQIDHRPHLDTVVILKGFDANDELCGAGTGFFCHARHYHRRTRKLLFLVTNAHVVGRAHRRFDVLFRPLGAEEAFVYPVTARSGAGPGTWFTDKYCDIAALLLTRRKSPTKSRCAPSTWRPTPSPSANSANSGSRRGPRGGSWDS